MSDTPTPNFSMLVMSIASSAAMALGLAPHPQSGKTEIDRGMARFNIDLLIMLQGKTKGQLTKEEEQLLEHIVSDLQLKFIQQKT
ncbi:MAG: DUF1844 domain-containing protein [Bdellovibrionales bacterium]